MKSMYKKLGSYIREVTEKNTNLDVSLLLGVSITKKFIPSIANTIGTDMSNYKIVRQNQFAYGPVTSRNGDKISVALLKEDICIVSTSYIVFEIIDTQLLDPEYLMMWFMRTEFDRYARFKSHGSVRELFDWNELCDVELPIPALNIQKKITQQFNLVERAIQEKKSSNQMLEELAENLFKSCFINFDLKKRINLESPCVDSDLINQVSQSLSTEFIYNETLEKNIPSTWKVIPINEFTADMKSGGTPSRAEPSYWNRKDIPWLKTGEVANCVLVQAEEYISDLGLKDSSAKLLPINSVLIAMYGDGKTKGQVGFLRFQATTNQACCAMICNDEYEAAYLYFYLRFNYANIVNQANGGAQENLSKKLIEDLPIIVPNKELIQKLPFLMIINLMEVNERQTIILKDLKDTLLSRMSIASIS